MNVWLASAQSGEPAPAGRSRAQGLGGDLKVDLAFAGDPVGDECAVTGHGLGLLLAVCLVRHWRLAAAARVAAATQVALVFLGQQVGDDGVNTHDFSTLRYENNVSHALQGLY